MITKEIVRAAYRNNVIQLVSDPATGFGIAAQIGKFHFYFGGEEEEEMSLDEYRKNVPEEDIVRKLYEELDSFRTAAPDVYAYYEKHMQKGGKKTLLVNGKEYTLSVGAYEKAPMVMRIIIRCPDDEEEITVLPEGMGNPGSFLAYGCCFMKKIQEVLDALEQAECAKPAPATMCHLYMCNMVTLAEYDPEGVAAYRSRWAKASERTSFKNSNIREMTSRQTVLTEDERQLVLSIFERLEKLPKEELYRIVDPIAAKKMHDLKRRLQVK